MWNKNARVAAVSSDFKVVEMIGPIGAHEYKIDAPRRTRWRIVPVTIRSIADIPGIPTSRIARTIHTKYDAVKTVSVLLLRA